MVWKDIKTKDIRDVLKIARLTRNLEDIEDIAHTLMKYKPKD